MSKKLKMLKKLAKLKDKKWFWFIEKDSAFSVSKGVESEKKFKRMVEILRRQSHLPWILDIAPANDYEDLVMKIDFKLRAVVEGERLTKFNLLINVKSSEWYAEKFRKDNPSSNIHAIVMDQQMTLPELRSILDGVYLVELERRALTSR